MDRLTIEQVKVKLASYCAYQERCSSDVFEKLKEFDLTEDEMIALMRWLSQERYLDDLRFAKQFVHGKFYIKKWGRVKIKYELRKKGIVASFIKGALLEEIDQEDYINTAITLAKNKLSSLGGHINLNKQKKVQVYLQQKGFEWEVIKDAIEQVKQS